MAKRLTFPFVMKFLATSTAVATIALTILCHFVRAGWLLAAAISFGTTAYHFCMRLAVGYLIP